MRKEELDIFIKQAVEGDKIALEKVLMEVNDFVFNLSLRMLGNISDAQDATCLLYTSIDESLKDLEKVVGLQTDKPLKRAFMPYGGIKMAEQACQTYGYEPSEKLHEIFTKYHKTHNQGVFDVYTPEIKKARHNKVITGLPDTYGRGRIVGDYRRVALYLSLIHIFFKNLSNFIFELMMSKSIFFFFS